MSPHRMGCVLRMASATLACLLLCLMPAAAQTTLDALRTDTSLTDAGPQWPVRRSGLWQITLQTQGVAPQLVRHCIDPRTDRVMQQMAEGTDATTCSRRTYRREGDRFIGESECRFGTSTALIRSSVAGDFARSYKGEVDSRIEPPTAGLNQFKVSLTARWLSACPAGWKPGDMDVPGMGRVNIAEVQAARKLSTPPTPTPAPTKPAR